MVGATSLLLSSRPLSRLPLPSLSSSSFRPFSSASVLRNHHHRPIPNPTTPSLLRRHIKFLPPFSQNSFASLSSTAASTTEFSGVEDEVVEKLGFEKVSEDFIPDCNSKALLFRHKKTGAQVVSLSNHDKNKVFGIAFRTPPKDSTGVAHIMEYGVFCGSRKFPSNKPFNKLLKGTLSTYINPPIIMPDRTCFSGSCKDTKELYNLVDLCLDAVFFPKCVENFRIFQKLGWHYELNDPSEDITIQGFVFNKMKKMYSMPDMMLRLSSLRGNCITNYEESHSGFRSTHLRRESVIQALFPDNCYGLNNFGDPNVITKLTFEEFKEFQRKYYHPSNAKIWFYGDDDPTERLRNLTEYLDMFDASSAPNESRVEPQKLLSEPVRIIRKYPCVKSGDLKKKNSVCIVWLLSDKPLDLETEKTLGLLCNLMMRGPASSLSKVLLESGLGGQVEGGFHADLLQPTFHIGMKGVSGDDIQKVEELIMSTVKKLAEDGFDTDAVKASFNTMEFFFREKMIQSFPRGMFLMLQSIKRWIYDMDPFEPLKYEKCMMALKSRIKKEGSKAVLSPLIEKFILNNPHRVVVEMQPDPEKASNDEAAEKEFLKKFKAGMTEGDLAKLVHATQELR